MQNNKRHYRVGTGRVDITPLLLKKIPIKIHGEPNNQPLGKGIVST